MKVGINLVKSRFLCAVMCAVMITSVISVKSVASEMINSVVHACDSVKYVKSSGIVSGISPGTTASQLITHFDGDVTISGKQGDDVISTADTVIIGVNTAQTVIYGDINCDGKITVVDALFLRKTLVGIIKLENAESFATDTNLDGHLNMVDELVLKKSIVGISKIRNSSLYYVSQNGNDDSDGSEENPYRTVSRAAAVMTAGDTCFIMSGTYRETVKPLASGENGAPITFVAYGDDDVTVSGTEKLNGKWISYKDGIYKMNTGLFRGDENQLFVGGRMATLCRYPNKGSEDTLNVGQTMTAVNGGDTFVNGEIPFDEDELVGAKIAVQGTNNYLYYSSTVTSNSKNNVTYSKLNSGWDSPTAGSKFYLYDNLSLLDYDDEWYYDGSGVLYYKPSNGIDINSIDFEYSVRGQAFDISGRQYITVKNMTVFGANVRNDENSRGTVYDGDRFLYYYHTNVSRNYPWEADWWGVELHGENSVVKNCEIAFGAEGGVIVYADNCSVVNNYIHDINYINSNAAAIEPRRCNYTLISHNTIRNVARSAIICSSANLRICYNDISDCAINTSDVSCIGSYKLDAKYTIEIDHNNVHDTKGVAYYLDNGSLHFTVHHNVAQNVERAMILNNPSYGNLIYNNTLTGPKSITTGNLQNPFDNNAFIGSVWTGDQFINNIMPSIFYGDGAYFCTNLFDGDESVMNDDLTLKDSSNAINIGSATALGQYKYIGAYEYDVPKWKAGQVSGEDFSTEFILSRLDMDFVPTAGNVFEQIGQITGENMLSKATFPDEFTVKSGWSEQIFDVKEGEMYYISCNARLTENAETYLEFGVHFLDDSWNITEQGGFLYTQTDDNRLETIIKIPKGCKKMRYFTACWADCAVQVSNCKLIKIG